MRRFACLMMMLALVAAPVQAERKPKKPEAPAPVQSFSGTVVKVIDGDTLILDGDRRVRLLDINTPEMNYDSGKPEPYAREATDKLRKLVFGQRVTVQVGPKAKDKFGRELGHVYLPNGGWVNGTLVRDGYAHVYTFADNAMYPAPLLAYEQQARQTQKGLWKLPKWRVAAAEGCCGQGDIGTFKLVEGRVLAAMHVRNQGGRTYLNFGADWKTDFSVFVADKDVKWFKKAGIKDIATHYKGKTVRVRGYLQPVNGVLVRVTHPAQLEIVE